MNTGALIVMIVAMVMVWGGLVFSVVHLTKNPDIPLDEVTND